MIFRSMYKIVESTLQKIERAHELIDKCLCLSILVLVSLLRFPLILREAHD